jgi:hypothetical protein
VNERTVATVLRWAATALVMACASESGTLELFPGGESSIAGMGGGGDAGRGGALSADAGVAGTAGMVASSAGGSSFAGGAGGAAGSGGAKVEAGAPNGPCTAPVCCTTRLDCPLGSPACVGGACVECETNSDCDGDEPVCDLADHDCEECDGDCKECTSDAQCPDGTRCNLEGECE